MGSKQLGAVMTGKFGKWSSLWNSRIAIRLWMHATPARLWRGSSGTAVRIQGDLTNFGIGNGIGIGNRHCLLLSQLCDERRNSRPARAAKCCELLALQSAHSAGTASTGSDAAFGFFKLMGSSFEGKHS
jgi:hypothetical protein